jgi:hypothetical protein
MMPFDAGEQGRIAFLYDLTCARHRNAVIIWGVPRTHGTEGHNYASRRQ